MEQRQSSKEAFDAYCAAHPNSDPSASLHQDSEGVARQYGSESEEHYAEALRAAKLRVGMYERGEL